MLIQQQQAKINELVSKAQVETIQMMAEDNHISLSELDSILQPIIDTCTKDSISSGEKLSVNKHINIFMFFFFQDTEMRLSTHKWYIKPHPTILYFYYQLFFHNNNLLVWEAKKIFTKMLLTNFSQAKAGYYSMPHHMMPAKWYPNIYYEKWHSRAQHSHRNFTSFTWSMMSSTIG